METLFTNCKIITRNETLHGTLVIKNGLIDSIDTTISMNRSAIDLQGDFLLPGLIELHTDNLEKNIQPRPGVFWPSILSATLAHDAQIAGAGITTVLDAIAVGGLRESSLRSRIFSDSIEAIKHGKAEDLFKADHFLHLRCEISDEQMANMLLSQNKNSIIKLLSLMDHTPGQKQWSNIDKWKLFHRDKKWSELEIQQVLDDRRQMQELYADKHRKIAVDFAHQREIPLASHDDTTVLDIQTAVNEGVSISEFPTTLTAARSARREGMVTIMGAPNAVRGESHSGNISSASLAAEDLLVGLSSDYVPTSLLHSAFSLSDRLDMPLYEAVAMISINIAEVIGFSDRGELKPGKRADLIRVSKHEGIPVLKQVWKKGIQIA